MRYNYMKLLLIYKYELFKGDNDKLLGDMASKSKESNRIGFDFENCTDEEGQAFLRNWKKENNIKLTEYRTLYENHKYKRKQKLDENGIPYLCYKIVKN